MASANACLAFSTCACASRSWASVSGDEMVATTCPAVTSSPSSTVSVASRPGYFAETSTCVASMRPLVFTIPSGISRPRRRLISVSTAFLAFSIGFCGFAWAWALTIKRPSSEMPSADVTTSSATQIRAVPRTTVLTKRSGRCAVTRSNFNSRDDTGSAGTMFSHSVRTCHRRRTRRSLN